MPKILLITCYFGKFPWYFGLFLKSCASNPTIDFIIFSDCSIPKHLPENVKMIPFTIKEFNLLATEKLGFEVSIKSAYKLCDFKPAYGVIFSEHIKTYPFWGITDIDIVFGRIREFMTNELLDNYEVISVRNDYPTGSFMLFKNNYKINTLFMKSRDYKKVFMSDTHYCFDECNFRHRFLQEGGDIFDIDCEIESMHHIIKKEQKENNLKVHFDFLVIEGLPGQLKWGKGVFSFKNEFEILLYHLILYKANKYTRKKEWRLTPDTFYIDKYLIRKNGLTSFTGFLANTWYNIILPNFSKILFKVDCFLSRKLNIKMKGIKPGTYKLNRFSIEICKNSANENQVHFKKIKFLKMPRSIVFKGGFFIQSFPTRRYQFNKEKYQLVECCYSGNVRVLNKI
jgi:hypothetical protein